MFSLKTRILRRKLKHPFVISSGARIQQTGLEVRVEKEGHVGLGEASGVSYRGETPELMREQIEGVRDRVESEITPEYLQKILPAGGARFALDSALIDLQAKLTGVNVFDRYGLKPCKPLVTAFTIVLDSPEAMQEAAEKASSLPLLKVKLGGKDGKDAARARAVRQGAPKARMIADANAGWTLNNLMADAGALADAGFELLEQPLPANADGVLEDFKSPLPLCGDESIQDLTDLNQLGRRYDVINIKLDKCGGLTHALAMRDRLSAMGKRLFVGCMVCGVRAIAPAYALAQNAEFVDLDGPLWLAEDDGEVALSPQGLLSLTNPVGWGSAKHA